MKIISQAGQLPSGINFLLQTAESQKDFFGSLTLLQKQIESIKEGLSKIQTEEKKALKNLEKLILAYEGKFVLLNRGLNEIFEDKNFSWRRSTNINASWKLK